MSGFTAVAFGAAAVFAGVVGVVLVAAILALVDMAPHGLGAATGNVGQRPPVAGEHP